MKIKSLSIGKKIEMNKYHKIQTVYKRDLNNNNKTLLEGQYSLPAFDYLATNTWVWTEKIDGTNIRVIWDWENKKVLFHGKTDNAQIPAFLFHKLQELFPVEKFESILPDYPATLYGEGFGLKIQKAGKHYIKDGVSFSLFDVNIDGWWLERHNVEDIGNKMETHIVPIIGEGNLKSAVELTRLGFNSSWGDFIAEGLVMRPKVELQTRGGERIISKIKYKDFVR